MEAYVQGVSTRAVDNLVAALGAESGIKESEVSRICAGLDELVGDVHDEWQAADRRYLSEGSMALLYPERDTGSIAELTPGD